MRLPIAKTESAVDVKREYESVSVSNTCVVGYIISFVGTAVWVYGYFVIGNPPLIGWRAITPWWIADFLPNIQSEIGMALVLASMVPIYWPLCRRR